MATAIDDREPELIRVLEPVREMARSWRIMATRKMRRTPKIYAFFHFITFELTLMKAILTG